MTQDDTGLTLGAAADLFLGSLGGGRTAAQQELLKFLRWFGREKPPGGLTPPEIEAYSESVISGAANADRHLKVVREFLVFSRKKGLVSTSLAPHLRVRRTSRRDGSGGSRAAGGDNGSVRLTAQGYRQLEEQLAALQKEAVRAATEIKKAAADKDVRENAPLEAARQRLGEIASRTQEIEAILERAEVLGDRGPREAMPQVRQGSRVTLKDLSSGEELTYVLVDPREANSLNGKLSIASPVGQAMLERREGEEVEVMAPRGALRYGILKVE